MCINNLKEQVHVIEKDGGKFGENLESWNQNINLSQGRVDTVSIARKRLCKKKLLDLKKILE